jgi:hypothetical protein
VWVNLPKVAKYSAKKCAKNWRNPGEKLAKKMAKIVIGARPDCSFHEQPDVWQPAGSTNITVSWSEAYLILVPTVTKSYKYVLAYRYL